MTKCNRTRWSIILAGVCVFGAGCASKPPPPPPAPPPATEPAVAERPFASPQAAVDALVAALRANDKDQLKQIFGPDGDAIIASGDDVGDQAEASRFLTAYDTKHSLQTEPDGSTTLIVGANDWPMPVPIVKADDEYVFDTLAGKDEILNRRIGRNELATQLVCLAIVDAERDYVAQRPMGGGLPVYARKIRSDPGTRDGLYWETQPGEPPSPLGPLIAYASAEGYGVATRPTDAPPPTYHGYRYRLLTAQGEHARGGAMDYEVNGQLVGGFAVVAYPANYGSSGIMTFITNHDGIVYERDLGLDTESIAKAMTKFDPGPEWTRDTSASTQPTTEPTEP
jgi:hypothetical protein